ncbi:MAG: DUF6022 family protein [Ardenticatenaceae bacterium]|nr:DUF6022 family protein [Ardenticatenaceae bacterium]
MGLKRRWELGRAEQVFNVALRRAHEEISADAWADGGALWPTLGEKSYARYWAWLRHGLGDPWQPLELQLAAPLPGPLATSVEWRSAHGGYIRRFTLPVVGTQCGQTVAYLVLDFAHSHARFNVPRPPQARLVPGVARDP